MFENKPDSFGWYAASSVSAFKAGELLGKPDFGTWCALAIFAFIVGLGLELMRHREPQDKSPTDS